MKYPTTTELLQLSAGDRLRLLEDVWDTFTHDANTLPVSVEHRLELDRRLEELERTPDASEPWPVLRERITRTP